MAREKKDKPKWGPQQVALARKTVLVVAIALVTITLAAIGLHRVNQYVGRTTALQTERPTVVLANRPSWMSDRVCQEICAAARPEKPYSALDPQALRVAFEVLKRDPRISPWIKEIHHVKLLYRRKPGDTLEIDCEYRIPIALVHGQSTSPHSDAKVDYYYLVDGDGVALPERYTPEQLAKVVYGRDGRMNIRVVEGIDAPPPTLPGKRWPGNDLRAGLEMARALAGHTYTEEIMKIDMTNFQGRVDEREAHIVLWTKHTPPTQIRWGRPESDKGSGIVEIPPADKMVYLQKVFQQFGRVDAGRPWIDIRFDHITYPADPPPTPLPAPEVQQP